MKSIYLKKITKTLANLQLAISLLIIIGIIISFGTFIEQDQSLNFYKENYPVSNPLFGFITWKLITFTNLDHLYSTGWFLFLLFLFGSSLLSCTFTTQIPTVQNFRIWKFYSRTAQFKKLDCNSHLQSEFFNTLAYRCNEKNYHFFRQRKKGYAYSGLLGRVAPVIVHFSIVLLLIGSSISSFSGFIGQELIPRGEIAHIQNLTKFGSLTYIPQNISCRINDFWITYTKDQKPDQFYSDLSLLDEEGKEVKRKTVFVNEPLLFKNLVVYQTDWDIIGLKINLSNKSTNKVFQIPLRKISKNGRNFWIGSISLNSTNTKNFSVVKSSLNEKLSLYNEKGILLKESELGSFVRLNEQLELQFIEYITSTGLQIKSDPGIFTVYTSFLFLMASIYVSFFTYSQIWFVEKEKLIQIGGKSNRAVLFFQEEFRKILSRTKKTAI